VCGPGESASPSTTNVPSKVNKVAGVTSTAFWSLPSSHTSTVISGFCSPLARKKSAIASITSEVSRVEFQ